PDLAATNLNSNTVSVLLGNGDGSFVPQPDLATEDLAAPIYVAIGDISADGKPDLATANFTKNTVSVWLGNGDGSFGGRVDIIAGYAPHFVAMHHLDGDANVDLVAVNQNSNTVTVHPGNGDGSFPNPSFAAGGAITGMAVGDLNGDGHADA